MVGAPGLEERCYLLPAVDLVRVFGARTHRPLWVLRFPQMEHRVIEYCSYQAKRLQKANEIVYIL